MASKPANGVLTHSSIKFWLPIILVVVSLAVSWGVWITRLAAIEQDVAMHDIKIETIDDTFTTIKVQLAEIELHLVYIREQIDKR